MLTIREKLEAFEKQRLGEGAALSSQARRIREERPCHFRTSFQKDRDKIIHSKAFRRLKHKTQVFLSPRGDHYRTRLTHTLEVMQVGRTMARALMLNEDLVEAAALGHDLGHTPFGHQGESQLNELRKHGFHHARQSVRVVEKLENRGHGLNLTADVKEAIAKHSKGKGPILSSDPKLTARTLEGQLVRVADVIAYVNHDLDDAIRGGMLTLSDVPKSLLSCFGRTHAERIETMVSDVIESTLKGGMTSIQMSGEKLEALMAFRAFMFEKVYEHPRLHQEFSNARRIVESLYQYYHENPKILLKEIGISEFTEPVERHVVDFISGMTDRYAIEKYQELYLPRSWQIL